MRRLQFLGDVAEELGIAVLMRAAGAARFGMQMARQVAGMDDTFIRFGGIEMDDLSFAMIELDSPCRPLKHQRPASAMPGIVPSSSCCSCQTLPASRESPHDHRSDRRIVLIHGENLARYRSVPGWFRIFSRLWVYLPSYFSCQRQRESPWVTWCHPADERNSGTFEPARFDPAQDSDPVGCQNC